MFEGFLVGRNNVHINLLQNIDDTVFFRKATMAYVKAIEVMLRSFGLVSSLKINIVKNKFRGGWDV